MLQPDKPSRRDFLKNSMLSAGSIAVFGFNGKSLSNSENKIILSPSAESMGGNNPADWLQTARAFLLDAYQPPLVPHLQYDAEEWADMMVDMNVNVIRFGTMGKYATIQGVKFSTHPEQGNRDLLQETIDACKPRGIKVFAYISTGHKLGWSMVTKDYPEYAQRTTPGGLPTKVHMYVGEDMGTVCWMTPYRQAWMEYVTHVVRDYDVSGMYFDRFRAFYFWPGKKLCYCDGCVKGFKEASGLKIPYHENESDYTANDLDAIDKYHQWYTETFMREVVQKVRPLIKSYKDVPLMSNINNPQTIAATDPRTLKTMDAFLYERGNSMLERAEGVGVPRSIGLYIWPYIGTYHNWPRLAFQGANYQQEIFTNLMFGAGSIVAQPTGYIHDLRNREFVRYPFSIIQKHEKYFEGLRSHLHVGVVYAYDTPEDAVRTGWLSGTNDARTSTLGAFAACLYNHIQAGSVSEFVLDNPEKLKAYPILYLANIPFLSDERIKNISDYVRNGGCLIASCFTSLYNNAGERNSTFGLEELLRVKPVQPEGKLAEVVQSYQAMTGGPNDLYLLASKNNEVKIGKEWTNKLFPLWYYQPVEAMYGGKVVMDIVIGYNNQAVLPGVILSDYGKGKVLYCAAAMESLYNLHKPDVVGELIKGFVQMVSKKPAPYTLDAPAGLLSNLTEKENLMILHLTNWTGSKFEKPHMNEYDLAPVEHVRLKIQIPDGKKVKNISTALETAYDKKVTDRSVEIYLPKLEAYQAIIIETV